ncbi:dTDP-4-dehydrorhamnose reductase [Anthocerotibacter panamensis]|uniref:dTDP-4-dehydrorhamnose reductase n=1 Tax=Anthocerotibacter panamensis TaxID=2857077 RepID=UPI001C4060E9|nr:dTDP-4-dehydrorhamnose reductase [Anthocerotibacter panamensis]
MGLKILVTGKQGQVGWELARSMTCLGEVIALDRAGLDLSQPETIRQTLRELRPQLIVNAAAYTAVDQAEKEPDLAQAINGTAPGILAEEAQRLGAALVHYSTDYVFDGTKRTPYRESDPVQPLGVYGQTKLAGEQAIQAVGVPHLILRTSWVYGMRGKNFLLTILRLAREREELKIVEDQTGAPTPSGMLGDFTTQILLQGKGDPVGLLQARGGLYHLSAAGETTWYHFARVLLERISDPERKLQRLLPIPTSAYPTPAQRPAYSVLDNQRLQTAFQLQTPTWEEALSRCTQGA